MNKIINVSSIIGLILSSLVSMYLSFQGIMVIIDEPVIAGFISLSISLAVAIFGYHQKESYIFKFALLCVITVSVSLNFAGKTTQINNAKQKNEASHSDSSQAKMRAWEKSKKDFINANISRVKSLYSTEIESLNRRIKDSEDLVNKLKSEVRQKEKLVKRHIKPNGNKQKIRKLNYKIKSLENNILSMENRKIEIGNEVIKASKIPYDIPPPVVITHKQGNLVSNEDISSYLAYLLSLITDVLAILFTSSIRKQKEDDLIKRDETEQHLKEQISRLSDSSRDLSHKLSDSSREINSLELKVEALIEENKRLKGELKATISEKMTVAKIKEEAIKAKAKAEALITKNKAKKAADKITRISSEEIVQLIKKRHFIPDKRLETVSINIITSSLGNNSRSVKQAAKEAISKALELGLLVKKGNSTAYPINKVASLSIVGSNNG